MMSVRAMKQIALLMHLAITLTDSMNVHVLKDLPVQMLRDPGETVKAMFQYLFSFHSNCSTYNKEVH